MGFNKALVEIIYNYEKLSLVYTDLGVILYKPQQISVIFYAN